MEIAVTRHIKKAHNETKETPKKIPCSVCGRLLVKAALKGHEARHLLQKNPSDVHCDICGRTTTEKQYMLTHMERIHLKLKK